MTLQQSPTKPHAQNLETQPNLVTPTNQKLAENINTTSENMTTTTNTTSTSASITHSGHTTERSNFEEPSTCCTATCMTPSVTPTDSKMFSGQHTDRSSSTDGIEVITETENEMMDESKHYLHDKWCFWYMDTSEKGKGKSKKGKYDKKKNQQTPVAEKAEAGQPSESQKPKEEQNSEQDSGIQFSVDKIVRETTKEMTGNSMPEAPGKIENLATQTQAPKDRKLTENLTQDDTKAKTETTVSNPSANPQILATTNAAPTIPNIKKCFCTAWSKQLVNYGKLVTLSNVEDFINWHENCMPPSKLGSRHDYMFFRDGIVPEWDDFRNREGGKWMIILPNSRDVT